ncbi:MAG: hypothetical protein WC675_03640 [Patescibacteria group bacterium]|jgi:hypothetical protein
MPEKILLFESNKIIIDFNKLKPDDYSFKFGSYFGTSFAQKIITIKDPKYITNDKSPNKKFYPISILHEIGHSKLHKSPPNKKPVGLIKYEMEAWEYALEEIKDKKLKYNAEELQKFISKCLKSYIKNNHA